MQQYNYLSKCVINLRKTHNKLSLILTLKIPNALMKIL